MPPRKKDETGETSFTGISQELRAAARAYTRRTGTTLRRIYDEAITLLIERISEGEDVVFRASIPKESGQPYHIRLSKDVLTDMERICDENRVHKSVFFRRALRDFLATRGESVEDD